MVRAQTYDTGCRCHWWLSKHTSVQLFSFSTFLFLLLQTQKRSDKIMPNSAGSFGYDTKPLSLKRSFTHVTPFLTCRQINERDTELNTTPRRSLDKVVYGPKLAQSLMNTCSVAAGQWLESSVTPGCRSVVPCLALTGVLYPPPSGPQIPAFGFWLPNDNTFGRSILPSSFCLFVSRPNSVFFFIFFYSRWAGEFIKLL